MDVKGHERLFKIKLRHKFKYRISSFIAGLHFNHIMVFNNELNSYPKMSVKTACI